MIRASAVPTGPHGVVGAGFGLERRRVVVVDVEAHAYEQLREHVVGLEHEAIGVHFERDVAIAEVVGGLGERQRGARRVAARCAR